jgi:hypothetical protein
MCMFFVSQLYVMQDGPFIDREADFSNGYTLGLVASSMCVCILSFQHAP